jgi:hypothetical protein
MNDDPIKLQRSLEQATSAEPLASGEMDRQIAALREAWLAFGQLLDAAAPTSAPTIVPLRTPRPARRRPWVLAAAAALAASLLIAVASVLMSNRPVQPIAGGVAAKERPQPSPEGNNAISGQAAAKPAPKSAVAADVQREATPARQVRSAPQTNQPSWDDDLDKQMAAAGKNLISLQQQWVQRSGGYEMAQFRLEQIQSDVKDNSL